jgi:GNAT superfamily N-acetyltransferase
LKETAITFEILASEALPNILPMLVSLNNEAISEKVLAQRLSEMSQQNYSCVGVYDGDQLVGMCGLWFQTRHYAGKSVEMDHVFLQPPYRNKGIGKLLMDYVYDLARHRNCLWVELNTYVHNFASHKFYYNQGFVAKGYHFIKEL